MITNKNILILFFLFAIGFIACENYDGEIDCSECYQEEPAYGLLLIDVTINDENDSVPVTIYKGKIEDKKEVWFGWTNSAACDVSVKLDELYTVTAEYNVGDKKLIAVDSDKIKKHRNSSDCDTICWIITGGFINAKLKYKDIPEE